MSFSSLQSLRATSIKHHDRAFTLVFGSDGQVSLIGFDNGTPTQPLGASPALTAGNTGAPVSGTHTLPNESESITSIPKLEATSASLSVLSFTSSLSPTSIPSPLTSSGYGPSSTTTDTDTYLPSIPTVDYPTPAPTAVSDPKDQGVGAPFYLAMVLASISFIGCVAAFIAWWIRSRARKHDLELDDPWHHRDTVSDAGSPFTDNTNESAKGTQMYAGTQARPYYLPASIVRRSSPNLLVPHTIPTLEDAPSQSGFSRTMPVSEHLGNANLRLQNSDFKPNPHQDVLSIEATKSHSRPATGRLQTGLSVQESTRTLGRLRVANRVPGDVTSGDEGGVNMPHIQSTPGEPGTNYGGSGSASVGIAQEIRVGQSERRFQEGDGLLEPPGPATFSWARKMDTVAALQRTRRRTPETTVQTYKNSGYDRYWDPALDRRQSGTTWQTLAARDQRENNQILTNSQPDTLGWTNSLRSSFWQAVDAMTRSRSSGPETRAENSKNGSGFTPAPQQIAPRRSPISLTRSLAVSIHTDAPIDGSQETEARSELSLTDNSVIAQELPQDIIQSSTRSSSTRTNESGVRYTGKGNAGQADFFPQWAFHSNHGPSAQTLRFNMLKTDTGSLYSMDSAIPRADLQRHGYTDSIPSNWSALGASRQSQLDLSRLFLPLPRPTPSSSTGPLSIAPSHLMLESGVRTGSASVRTRTTTSSESDIIGSDTGTLWSGKSANTASHSYLEAETSPAYGMPSDATIRSRLNTMRTGTASLQSSSTTSSMLSRKKGVTKHKRPRPPPRAPSTASSVQSVESRLSTREVAVRRALLERRRKAKTAGSQKDYEDSPTRSRGGVNPSVLLRSTHT